MTDEQIQRVAVEMMNYAQKAYEDANTNYTASKEDHAAFLVEARTWSKAAELILDRLEDHRR